MIDKKMHDSLRHQVLNALSDNMEITSDETPDQIGLNALSFCERRLIRSVIHLVVSYGK